MSLPPSLLSIRAALDAGDALPALGPAADAVSRIASDDSDSVDRLAQAVLSDACLTLRLLREANSPLHRIPGTAPVTTVSRATMLLGFDRVRSLALAAPTVEQTVEGSSAEMLEQEYARALHASAAARLAMLHLWPSCAEEAAIAALLRSTGRMVASLHAPEALARIREQVARGRSEGDAARRTLGLSFDELALQVASGHGLPARLGEALRPMAARPTEPRSAIDAIALAAAFGAESAALRCGAGAIDADRALASLAARFGDALGLGVDGIRDVLDAAGAQAAALERSLGLPDATDVPAPTAVPGRHPAPARAGRIEAAAREAEGGGTGTDPIPTAAAVAHDVSSTVSRMSEAAGSTGGIGAVARLATQAVREVLGASRAVWFARDDATAAFRPRAAAGCELEPLRSRIAVPVGFAPDVFHAALSHGADLHIADLSSDSIRTRLPAWMTDAFPDARGFVLLPVPLDGRPGGFFYADTDVPGAAPPAPAQVRALRALRDAMIAAMRAEPVAR